MNHCHRRLMRAFVESGGDMADETQRERLAAFVREQVDLLSPSVRLALNLVLGIGEHAYYEEVADLVSEREGRLVTSTSIRARVSRGMRALERAIRGQGERALRGVAA